MKIILALALVLFLAACVRISLQPPTPAWAEWCIKEGGKLRHVHGPIWVCDLTEVQDDNGST